MVTKGAKNTKGLFIVAGLGLLAVTLYIEISGTRGNADGYNGGDSNTIKWNAVKATLGEQISEVQKRFDMDKMCNPAKCNAASSLYCSKIQTLNSEQQMSCRQFWQAHLSVISQMNLAKSPQGERELASLPQQTDLQAGVSLLKSYTKKLAAETHPGFANQEEYLDTLSQAFFAYLDNNAIEGFFLIGEKGYLGQASGHYCYLTNWQKWLDKGGPAKAEQAARLAFIPKVMVNDGDCP